jgi:hypothetical protein
VRNKKEGNSNADGPPVASGRRGVIGGPVKNRKYAQPELWYFFGTAGSRVYPPPTGTEGTHVEMSKDSARFLEIPKDSIDFHLIAFALFLYLVFTLIIGFCRRHCGAMVARDPPKVEVASSSLACVANLLFQRPISRE